MLEERVSKSAFKAKALKFFRQIEASKKPMVITDPGHPKLEVRLYRRDKCNPLEGLRGAIIRYDHPMAPVAEDDGEMGNATVIVLNTRAHAGC